MSVRVLHGDCREILPTLPAESVNCCVTSPPYWGLRDYGCDGQIGLEQTPEAYVAELVAVFREVRRVLRGDGTVWLNLGDSYSRDPGKGGSGPNGKHDFIPDYGNARKILSESRGSSDGKVGRGDRAPVRVGGGSLKPKDLVGIPWRVAFALQADGWYLRSDIIWAKPNPMPESVTDRPTKAHEYVFLLTKSARYWYDAGAIVDPALFPGDHGFLRGPIEGCDSDTISWRAKSQQTRKAAGVDSRTAGGNTRNARTVWTIATQPFSGAHFATMPPALAERCTKAGCPEGGTVLDPFGGAGTTGLVADRLGRNAVLIELNPTYGDMAQRRIVDDAPLFAQGGAA